MKSTNSHQPIVQTQWKPLGLCQIITVVTFAAAVFMAAQYAIKMLVKYNILTLALILALAGSTQAQSIGIAIGKTMHGAEYTGQTPVKLLVKDIVYLKSDNDRQHGFGAYIRIMDHQFYYFEHDDVVGKVADECDEYTAGITFRAHPMVSFWAGGGVYKNSVHSNDATGYRRVLVTKGSSFEAGANIEINEELRKWPFPRMYFGVDFGASTYAGSGIISMIQLGYKF